MRVGVLGRPAVFGAGTCFPLAGAREAGLLALLVSYGGRVVRSEVIEDELWDGRRVSDATLRVAINRLRNRFVELTGDHPLSSEPSGYRLLLQRDDVDAFLYEDLVECARSSRINGDSSLAVQLLDDGELLWRSDAYDGFTHLPSVQIEHERLHELRCSAHEIRAAALIELGELNEAIFSLQRVMGRYPFRESLRALHMVALARMGRQREAQRSFTDLQQLLDEELGVRPNLVLETLQQSIANDRPASELTIPSLVAAATAPSAPRTRQSLQRRVVGRDRELAQLHSTVATAQGPRLIAVSGEPGIGKTALVDAFLREHRETGALAVSGRCDRQASVPLRPFLEAFDEVLRTPGDPVVDELESLLASRSDELGQRFLDFDLRRYRVLTLFSEVIVAAASQGPAVVMIDDAQWIDPLSASLVEQLLRNRQDLPLLVVVTLLPSSTGEGRLDQLIVDLGLIGMADRIEMDVLSANEIGEVLGGDVSLSRVDLIHRSSGGNPLYALQLGQLLGANFDLNTRTLPPDLIRLCRARLAHLSPGVVEVLEAAAVIGHAVGATDVARVLGTSRSALSPALVEAQRAGLIEPTRSFDHFSFVHGVIRQACYDHIEPGRRAHLHWLAAQVASAAGGRLAEVAGHLAESRPLAPDSEIAAATLRAGGEAIELGAYGDAIKFFRIAIELGSPSRGQMVAARFGLGLGLAAGGELADSAAILTQAIDEAIELEQWELAADGFIARGGLGLSASIPEALSEALAVDQILNALPASDDQRRAHLLFWQCELLMNITPNRSAELLNAARSHARRLNAPTLDGLIEYARIRLADSTGDDPTRCEADAMVLCQSAVSTGRHSVAARAGLLVVGARLRSGRMDAARSEIGPILEHAGRANDPGLRLQCHLAAVSIDIASEAMDIADERSLEATLDPPSGLESLAFTARVMHLSIIRREQLRLGEIDTVLVGALTSTPRRFTRPLVAAARFEQGDLEAATQQLKIFSGEVSQLQMDWLYLSTLSLAAESAAESAFTALAEPIEERLSEQPPQIVVACNSVLVIGHLDRYLGLLAELRGDMDLAIARFASARCHDREHALHLWAAWSAHGEASARMSRSAAGDVDRSRALNQEASEIATAFGSARLAARVASLDVRLAGD